MTLTDHNAIAELAELIRRVLDGYWPAPGPDPRVPDALAALDSLLEELQEAKKERDQLEEQLAEATANGLRLIAENERLRKPVALYDEEYERLREIEKAARQAVDCLDGSCPYLHGGTDDDIANRLRAALAGKITVRVHSPKKCHQPPIQGTQTEKAE